MASRAKRLMVEVVAVVAVSAGAILAAEPAAAAKKVTDPNAFVITATVKQGTWSMTGSWRATGAIEGSGSAIVYYPYRLDLYGEGGSLLISLDDPAWWDFTTSGGTGAYAGVTGSGTFAHDVSRNGTMYEYRLGGTVGP
jgi:hypothetical protein